MTIEKTIAEAVAKELEPKLTELSKAIADIMEALGDLQVVDFKDVIGTPDPVPEDPAAPEKEESTFSSEINGYTYTNTWYKGVFRTDKAAISIPGTEENLSRFVKGAGVLLADGDIRTIIWAQPVGEDITLHLSGAILDGDSVGYPNKVFLATAEDSAPPVADTTPEDSVGSTVRDTDGPIPLLGMNVAGLEFGKNIPGKLGTDYFCPDEDNFKALADRGIKLVRLPFKWERIQRTLNGPLHAADVGYIQDCVDLCEKYGMKCIPDMHNYMRRKIGSVNHLIGSTAVPSSALADVWTKLAEVFKGNPTVLGLNIMNEPYPKQPTWAGIAQETYRAIREVDKETFIVIDGAHWANAEGWEGKNSGIPWFGDEYYRIIWDAHCYFDVDASGSYKDREEVLGGSLAVHHQIGVKRVKDFLDWCEKHDQLGMIGEFGAPFDAGAKNAEGEPAAWVAMENFMQYCLERNVPIMYFASGPNWTASAVNGIEIKGNFREPISILEKYGTMNLTTNKIGPV